MFKNIFIKKEIERPNILLNNQKLVWIPFAVIPKTKIKTQGKYPKGYPQGAVIHFTGGRYKTEQDAINCINYLALEDKKNNKYPYPCLVISRSGQIYQPFPINEWGYHTGTVDHRTKIGIELVNPGKLIKKDATYKTYYGEIVTDTHITYSEGKENIEKGYYLNTTPQQLDALINLLLWLKNNNEDIFSFNNIVGHDELAKGRKQDPGAIIPWTMSEFRKYLMDEYINRYQG